MTSNGKYSETACAGKCPNVHPLVIRGVRVAQSLVLCVVSVYIQRLLYEYKMYI
jgi:hypothetical protein